MRMHLQLLQFIPKPHFLNLMKNKILPLTILVVLVPELEQTIQRLQHNIQYFGVLVLHHQGVDHVEHPVVDQSLKLRRRGVLNRIANRPDGLPLHFRGLTGSHHE